MLYLGGEVMREEIPIEYQDYVVGADLPGYLSGPHYKVVCDATNASWHWLVPSPVVHGTCASSDPLSWTQSTTNASNTSCSPQCMSRSINCHQTQRSFGAQQLSLQSASKEGDRRSPKLRSNEGKYE